MAGKPSKKDRPEGDASPDDSTTQDEASNEDQTVGQLQQMIQRAQDERFKLLRMIKDSRGSVSTPAPAGGAAEGATASQASERMRSIDAWVARRLDEFRQAESSINSRLAQMTRIEESFNRLSSVLRVQLEEAKPTGQYVAELRTQMQGALEQFLEGAKGQIEKVSKPLEERIDVLNSTDVEINDRLANFKRQMGKSLDSLKQHFAKTIEQGRAAANAMMEPFNLHIAQQIEVCQQRIGIAVEAGEQSLTQRLPDFERDAGAAAERVRNEFRQRLAEAQTEAIARFAKLDDNTHQKLNERMKEHDQATASVLESTEGTLRQRVTALKGEIAAMAQQAGEDFKRSAAEHEGRMAKMVASAEQALLGGADQVEQKVQQQTESIRRLMAESSQHLDRDVNALRDRAQKAASSAIEQVTGESSSIIATTRDALEEQIVALEDNLNEKLDPIVQRSSRKMQALQDQA